MTDPANSPATHRAGRAGRFVVPALLAVSVAVLVGCGQTRIVVVPNNGVAAAPTPSTPTAAAAPSVSGPASNADAAAIDEAIQMALGQDPDRGWADRSPYTVGAEDTEQTFNAVFDVIADLDVDLVVGDITTDGANATASVDIILDGAPLVAAIPVALQLVDEEWKVTRDGVCAVLSTGSPCPEAAPTS